jgi:hypothetical protein
MDFSPTRRVPPIGRASLDPNAFDINEGAAAASDAAGYSALMRAMRRAPVSSNLPEPYVTEGEVMARPQRIGAMSRAPQVFDNNFGEMQAAASFGDVGAQLGTKTGRMQAMKSLAGPPVQDVPRLPAPTAQDQRALQKLIGEVGKVKRELSTKKVAKAPSAGRMSLNELKSRYRKLTRQSELSIADAKEMNRLKAEIARRENA